jgi:hypothetical protein
LAGGTYNLSSWGYYGQDFGAREDPKRQQWHCDDTEWDAGYGLAGDWKRQEEVQESSMGEAEAYRTDHISHIPNSPTLRRNQDTHTHNPRPRPHHLRLQTPSHSAHHHNLSPIHAPAPRLTHNPQAPPAASPSGKKFSPATSRTRTQKTTPGKRNACRY